MIHINCINSDGFPIKFFASIMEQKQNPTSLQRYEAVMILAAVGDAMGYHNGRWEFNMNGQSIHQEMMAMTNKKGPLELTIDLDWRYSDDTVMHIATA